VDRIFLDANVLFYAAYRPGAGIARLWDLENTELVTSGYAAEEARVNLGNQEQKRRLESLLQQIEIVQGLAPLSHSVSLPEKDRPILQAALYTNATHLLTGDNQHFGDFYGQPLMGVLVLAPAEYLRRRR
jgi:predicted nucleic acid-binding protein